MGYVYGQLGSTIPIVEKADITNHPEKYSEEDKFIYPNFKMIFSKQIYVLFGFLKQVLYHEVAAVLK